MTTEHTLHDAPAASAATSGSEPRSLWRRLASPAYLVGKAPSVALLALLVQAVVASLAGTLMASLIGIVVLPLAGIGFGYVERWRLEKLGFGQIPNGHLKFSEGTLWDQVVYRYKEIATWRETGALLVATILGSVAGVLLVLEFSLFAALLGTGIFMAFGNSIFLNWSSGVSYLSDFEGYVSGTPGVSGNVYELGSGLWWVFVLAALLVLPVSAYLNGLFAAAGASLSKMILMPRAEEYERQAATLKASRTKIVDAFESERRRIERNLHDGVQQELVNLNLRLGLAEMEAKNLAAEDDERVASVLNHVVEARRQLAHAQTTLRDTVRGIYPAVLEDYGLKAALDELARHSVLPVRLSYDAPVRLPRDLERTAYYAVNEALTNTVKHAQAQRLLVGVSVVADSLVVTAEDDGSGGADPARGTGLSGLTERAAALGGTVQVDSPAGGPTRLTLVLPMPAV